ncbi:unnamed protein product [Acanthoscelides obtectus]|uniref:Uncharacterized protein n=1 Tax=Acanthoscelides obtectus TaxID=200917 RepID=A0A9P0JKT9_ACAOB|nr:unnamed protein product [Acanthoscelides obtectus]CAK1657952.1 hypothetical protein AOBTE_LOCUS20614 [Acanthoscelides obtectus]
MTDTNETGEVRCSPCGGSVGVLSQALLRVFVSKLTKSVGLRGVRASRQCLVWWRRHDGAHWQRRSTPSPDGSRGA